MEHNCRKINTVEISKSKDLLGDTDLYDYWYRCPYCKNEHVGSEDNFCSKCGCKVEWVE